MNYWPHNARATRSATYRYGVTATRRSLALYLAWEYGIHLAVKMLREAPKRFGTIAYFKTRREAEEFKNGLRLIVNWQRGRLGLNPNDGGIFT